MAFWGLYAPTCLEVLPFGLMENTRVYSPIWVLEVFCVLFSNGSFFFLGSLLIYMYKSILSQRPKDSLFNSCELPLSFCVDSYFLVFCPINFSCLGFTESLSSQLRKTNRGLFGFYPSRLQPGNSFKAVNWNTWMVYFISFLSGSLTCAACCLVSENLFHIFDCLIV